MKGAELEPAGSFLTWVAPTCGTLSVGRAGWQACLPANLLRKSAVFQPEWSLLADAHSPLPVVLIVRRLLVVGQRQSPIIVIIG